MIWGYNLHWYRLYLPSLHYDYDLFTEVQEEWVCNKYHTQSKCSRYSNTHPYCYDNEVETHSVDMELTVTINATVQPVWAFSITPHQFITFICFFAVINYSALSAITTKSISVMYFTSITLFIISYVIMSMLLMFAMVYANN